MLRKFIGSAQRNCMAPSQMRNFGPKGKSKAAAKPKSKAAAASVETPVKAVAVKK